MLALRLTFRAHPLVLLRRLLVATAAAGTGFLVLTALAHAAAHPTAAGASLGRLLWCAAPLAATAQLAVSVARTDPAARLQRGMTAAGLGPFRLTLLAAASTALTCALGVLLALIAFLTLRGDFGTAARTAAPRAVDAGLLGAGHPLPLIGALMLLSLVPLTVAAATAYSLRPRAEAGAVDTEPAPITKAPSGLPWGVAMTAAGLALESYTTPAGGTPSGLLPLPGHLIGSPPGVLAGWALAAFGLVLAGPGLVYLSGQLLCAGRPGALRLLSGRVLQEESHRLGRPLGVLCAVASGIYAAVTVYQAAPSRPLGPFTAIGAAIIFACVSISALSASLESRAARARTTAALRRLGASASTLHRATALRAVAVLLVLGPLTWTVAEMATLPLVH
ncbi:membrane protein [Streptomyces noursei ZPM]|uniref:Uncharacterized protein n=1 Tax=Streptomyces noursei TaxID=1971 RepID=A0A401R8D9_STRNR|nr:hypothetical protein [Streptomyces noursei]AKA06302.1 membrane protein [Streptomyces noursei ZPM]EOT04107.1 hypothetical protein K530_10248 [Streptomyces noursei CCRC 11814]EXU88507.1 membrane protein [Streptomyces noursei PD-1]UWS74680.1 hypothetical protein N1H47_27625 [Streptomyces noursei]GCB93882.1 hypothetical protein SALB_06673 [Streptomyces noursei]